MNSFIADLRFAFRYFGRNRLTVAIVVSVFALGIGANTALVTVIQSHVMRPAAAVPDDEALVRLWKQERSTRTAAWDVRLFTYAELSDIQTRTDIYSSVEGWTAHDVVLNPGDSIGARGANAQFVTSGFFSTLGVRLVAGNAFTPSSDDAPDMSAVMSFAMAEQLYGTAEAAVGQRVLVNDVPVHVTGLAPPAFQGAVRQLGSPALWIPVSARAEIARIPAAWLREHPVLEPFARVRPGITREQAAAVARQVVAHSLPDSAARIGMARTAHVLSLHALLPGDPETHEVIVIYGAIAVVGLLLLLITCTNVSSLMVAAAISRRHEIAVRLSLGASRARILRQLLTESTLLAIGGGVAALLVCWWLIRVVAGPLATIEGMSLNPDLGTLAFTLFVAVGTGIVFGLSPAFHATRDSVSIALHDSGPGTSRKSGLQRGFVVAQIMLSLPLLMILGVSLSMVADDSHVLPRSVSERVVGVTFRPLTHTGAPGQRREAVDAVIPHVATLPGVLVVIPDASSYDQRWIVRAPLASDSVSEGLRRQVIMEGTGPGWFALFGTTILLGRDVTLADTAERDWPVVIGSDLARALWGNANPIGRTLDSPDADTVRMTVVGVYDAGTSATRGDGVMRVYTAHGKRWRRDRILVHTRGAAEPLLPALRQMIRDRAPGVPIAELQTLAQDIKAARIETLKIGALVGAGAALALLLASLGLYGVIALAVRQRTREIGIRISLGASPGRVSRMFLGSGLRLGIIALVVGLPVSVGIARAMLSQRLAPPNVWLIGLCIGIALLAVTAAATWIPARRAALVDPAQTLRVD